MQEWNAELSAARPIPAHRSWPRSRRTEQVTPCVAQDEWLLFLNTEQGTKQGSKQGTPWPAKELELSTTLHLKNNQTKKLLLKVISNILLENTDKHEEKNHFPTILLPN